MYNYFMLIGRITEIKCLDGVEYIEIITKSEKENKDLQKFTVKNISKYTLKECKGKIGDIVQLVGKLVANGKTCELESERFVLIQGTKEEEKYEL